MSGLAAVLVVWVVSDILAIPLFIFWWTRSLDFTSSEIPGVLFMCLLGPFFLAASVAINLGHGITTAWNAVFPEDFVLWRRK